MSNSLSAAVRGPARTSLPFYASTNLSFLAASGAPTPLYRLYHELWGVTPVMLTVIFSVYVVTLLGSLLLLGRLSDFLGRRPLVFAALIIEIVSMALFATAHSTVMLILARAVQGLATGMATTSLSAALLDADKIRGPLISGLTPLLGMAVGNLAAGALATYAPHPLQAVYVVLLVIFAVQALLVWQVPESVSRQGGALASLFPRLTVPAQARRIFVLISPSNIAVWAWGGFYLSLMPSLVREVTGVQSSLLGCLVVSVLMASGAGAIVMFRAELAPKILKTGMASMVAGVLILLGGVIESDLAIMALGSIVGGFGFGAGFLGSLRALMPLAHPHERAGLMAAFYIESYLIFCVPAVAAGFLATAIGLAGTIQIYGAAVALLALTGLMAARKIG